MKLAIIQKYCFCLVLLFLFVQVGCDQGLEPEPPPQYGIAGTVFCRNWPPPYSVRLLALASLKDYPRENLITEVIRALGESKVAFTLLAFTYGDSSINYELLFSPVPPGVFQYVAVGQFFGPTLTDIGNPNFWRVAGVYYASDDSIRPGSVFVPANQIVRDINIIVDFQNPPPQP